MEDSRFSQMMKSFTDKIVEQAWFQSLRQKWDELDPQSKLYLKAASSIGGVLLVFVLVLSAALNVRGLKKELAEKTDLLLMIQTGNEEMRRLKESAPPGLSEGDTLTQPWGGYFEAQAAASGIDKSSVTIQPEKPGSNGEITKEVIHEIQISKVGIRQVVRMAYSLESGSRPVKLRSLKIEARPEPGGTLDATLTVSAFTLKQ